ncbi:MAG: hypothetical protein ABL867_04850 [Rickettsiales bacterium]
MEELITFLSSDVGKLVCYVLMFVGITDILVIRIVLGINIKKLEQGILPGMPPQQMEVIEKKIKTMQSIIQITTFSGLAFIAFAVFGLTR